MCGHVPPALGWGSIKDAISTATLARISPSDSDRGKVLIANAIFVGKINFPAAAEIVPTTVKNEMAKILRFTLSGKGATLLKHDVLLSGPSDGNPV